MRVLMLAVNDPAGTAIAMCRAMQRHVGDLVTSARLATLETRYNHAWDADLHVPDLDAAGMAELRDLMVSADILHFHMTCDEQVRFGPLLPADYLAGKLVVHHHHGHPDFRGNPQKYSDKYRSLARRHLLVSTPDLLRLLPEARWQPNLVPLDDPAYQPLPVDQRAAAGPLRIAHSPTRRELKNTAEFLAACHHLVAKGTDIAAELIEDKPHRRCLARKRVCDAVFDHLQGYYGVSSLEGLALGLPVIAGLDDWCAGHMRDFAGEALPWLISRPERLEHDLADLARDRDSRLARGAASRAFMERAWSDGRLARRLARFYADGPEGSESPSGPR